jgi:hypothetical protein
MFGLERDFPTLETILFHTRRRSSFLEFGLHRVKNPHPIDTAVLVVVGLTSLCLKLGGSGSP